MVILDSNKIVYTVSGANGYTFYYNATLDSQSIEDNTSIITFRFSAKGNNNYSYNGFSGLGVELFYSTDNSTWQSLGYTSVPSISTTKVEKASKTFVLPHNNDGTQTVYLRAVYNGGETSYVPRYDSYTSDAITLTRIPRASSFTCADAVTIDSKTGSLAIAITKQVDTFYSQLTYEVGTNKGNIYVDTATSTTLSYVNILNVMPSSITGALKLTLTTYSDEYITSVGTYTKTIVATIDTSIFKPIISLGSIQINESPLTELVAGYSSALINANITNATGVTSYAITWSVTNGTIASVNGNTCITGKLNSSATDYELIVGATVKDSRGVTATAVSVSRVVYGYSLPQFTFDAFRSNSSGVADNSGAYYYYKRSAITYSNIADNTLVASIEFSDLSPTLTGTTELSGINELLITNSITIRATAYDKVITQSNAIEYTINIPIAMYPLDLVQEGNQLGIGLGKVAELGSINFGLPPKYSTTGTSGINFLFEDTKESGGSMFVGLGDDGITHGMYSNTLNDWLVKCDTNKKVSLNGQSNTSLAIVDATTPTNTITVNGSTGTTTSANYVATYSGNVIKPMTFANLLKSLGIMDYITDQGESNGWKYRLWASGKKECWYNQKVNISGAWGSWGNCYYKRLAPVGNYPVKFSSTPNLQITISPQGSDMWAYIRGSANYNTTAHPSEVGLMRSTTLSTSMTIEVYYYAVGE